MGIINKTTSMITKLGVLYEIAKHNKRQDIKKHIKTTLKVLISDVQSMLNTGKGE